MRTSTRSGYDDTARRSRTHQGVTADKALGSGSERLQELNQIGFLSPGEIQLELPVVVIDHRPQIGRTSIVKIWRMLPESP
jgi:hypothetical protein